MAHDDEELDWGEDEGWAADQTIATMDVDRPVDPVPASGDVSENQLASKTDDHPDVSEKVAASPEQRAETSFSPSTTRNGEHQHRDTRRTVSRSSSDFGKSLPPGLPQRPAGTAPHVERSDPLAASAMAPSPSKSTNGLPPDWEERKSRSNGAIYYFNLKTEETTWTKPTVANGAASVPIGEPLRPDSPTTSRRDRERRRPTSPSISSTLPPAPFGLPARPQFNSSQQRRSASPPPRARSKERQKEPERDSRGGRGDRRPAGPQARVSPPPRMRDVRDVHMRDPSPEPTRRYRSPSPQVARDREKAGGNRVYNDRERSPPPIPRGQRPSSPPLRRDDRGPRRPEDRYPPRTRSRSPGAPRRRSPSPPPMRRPRSPPRARDLRRPSPPPSSSLPQKRRGDTPPPSARSNVYPDRFDSQRDRDGQEDSQAKRRRVDDDRDMYESQLDRRDDRFGSRIGEEGKRTPEDPPPSKRPPLPPQDQRFRTATTKPPRRHRSPSPPTLPNLGPDGRVPSVGNSNSGRRDGFANERPHEGQGTRKREPEKIKLPETNAAVAAAYNRRRGTSAKDEVPSTVIPDGASSRDGPSSKLPPSGPGGRVQRAYGPALREGAPRPKSPEALTGREPPRGPRGVQRSPNIALRPLSPGRDRSPPRQRSPPRRESSPPPRRPRSPPLGQQSYPTLRAHDRDSSIMDYEPGSRSADLQNGRRESNRNQERGDRSQFGEVEQRGASRTQSLANQAPDGPVPRRERGRGRGRRPSPPPIAMKAWGQPQNKRSPQSPRENKVYDRDEDRNRYDDEAGRNRAPNDDAFYHEPRNKREQGPEEYSQGAELRRRQDHSHPVPPRHPPPRQPLFDELHPLEQDARFSGRYVRTHGSSNQFRDEMDLDEDHGLTNSARNMRDDGQSTRSGVSLEEDYGQRPDPLPEARRLSIWEGDERMRGEGSQDVDRRDDFDAAPYSAKVENGASGNRARGELLSPRRLPEEQPPQARRARSPSPGSSSHRPIRRQPSPVSRTMLEGSTSHKDATIGTEDRANGNDEQSRKDTIIGRPRIVRRDLSPLSTNGLSASREFASTQPTPISADSIKEYTDERGGPSPVGQGPSGKGSLLARLSAPGASNSGERSKGKRDQPGPSPTGGPSASLQARMENGERATAGRRDTDDGERRRKKSRRGRGGPGGARNRDAQG